MVREIQVYAKSDFSAWLKEYGPASNEIEDGVDIQDIDYVLFAYMIGKVMTLETKEHNGFSRDAQLDTQNVIRQLLMLSSNATCNTKRGVRPIQYLGHHRLQFQNTTPDNGWVRLDGKIVTRDALLLFLNFGRPLKRKVAVKLYEVKQGRSH